MEEPCDVSSNKRARDDEAAESSPESKRVKADLLFDILDDESEPDNTDLDYVMRSLEEEISMPVAVSDLDPKQPDLGFLLEASDDELGLPPPAEAAEEEVSSGEVGGGGEVEEAGFGKIWDDEIHWDLGVGSGEDNGGVIFDGGLFDFDGVVCGSQDLSDLTWRPEFLPAV